MTYQFDPEAIKSAVKQHMPMKDFLAKAGIDESTWYRWTRASDPTAPNTATLNKIYGAMDKLGIKQKKSRK